MLRKLALAIVAAASLGATALTPTAASAHPWGGWGGWGHYHHYYGGVRLGLVGSGCYVTRPVLTPWGYRLRTFYVCGY
jgi:hypothetical protein